MLASWTTAVCYTAFALSTASVSHAEIFNSGWTLGGWHMNNGGWSDDGGLGKNKFGWGHGGSQAGWHGSLSGWTGGWGEGPEDTDSVDKRAKEIVDGFSIDQVVGQMTQITLSELVNGTELDEDKVRTFAKQFVGSYLNTVWGDPNSEGRYGWTAKEWRNIVSRIQQITMEENDGNPMIYGLDSVHGANYVEDAVLFPQQINGGASFNPDLVAESARITGRDTEAAGIPWIFGPILDLHYNPLWSRTFETFGEDPHLTAVMGDALVSGLQSNNATAATVKHFMAYSATNTGHDRTDVVISDFDLLNKFLTGYRAGMEAGAYSVMESYNSINGEPVVVNGKILRDLIRDDMGYEGVIVTDWSEINNAYSFHRVASSEAEAVRMSLTRTSIDMSMVPDNTSFIDHAKKMLESHPEYEKRLRTSAQRIVKMKLMLGLYDVGVPGADNVELVGNEDDEATALALARESIVLTQNNDSVLPIPENSSVFLTGPSADNIGHQCGGWTLRWQGYSGNEMFKHGQSILHAMENMTNGTNNNATFEYFNGLDVDGSFSDEDMSVAMKKARASEYTVAVIGEGPYAEKPGDINDLDLPYGQIEYVQKLASTGTKVIVVYLGGRPRLLQGLPASVHGFIYGMLPCEFGGQAIAEILYGKTNPSGKMPITYPKDAGNVLIHYNHRVTTQCANGYCENEWDFGHGLSYTSFNYSDVSLSKSEVSSKDDKITAKVTVTNSGDRTGKETVMLFVTQPYRSISVPEVKLLKKFAKIELGPGESQDVEFELTFEDWSVFDPQIGNGFKRVTENGAFVVAFKADTDCDVYNDVNNPLCAVFKVSQINKPFDIQQELKNYI